MTLSTPSHALRPTVTRPSTAEPVPAWIGGVAKLGETPPYDRICSALADMFVTLRNRTDLATSTRARGEADQSSSKAPL